MQIPFASDQERGIRFPETPDVYTYRDLINDIMAEASKHGSQVLDLPAVADDFTVMRVDYQPPEVATEEHRVERETLTMVLRD